MAYDAGIGKATGNVRIIEQRYFCKVETGKGGAKILALAQNGQPGQAGLKAFQADFLEQAVVVGNRATPFLVMIATVIRKPPCQKQRNTPSSSAINPALSIPAPLVRFFVYSLFTVFSNEILTLTKAFVLEGNLNEGAFTISTSGGGRLIPTDCGS